MHSTEHLWSCVGDTISFQVLTEQRHMAVAHSLFRQQRRTTVPSRITEMTETGRHNLQMGNPNSHLIIGMTHICQANSFSVIAIKQKSL